MEKTLNLYTDGGCAGKNPSTIGGTWGWALVDHEDNLKKFDSGYVLPNLVGGDVTNNQMEYYAVLKGLEDLPNDSSVIVYSDSLITLGRMFQGWKNKNIPKEWIERLNTQKKRVNILAYRHLDGHPTKKQLEEGKGKRGNLVSKWNVMADKLCSDQAKSLLASVEFA